MRCYRCTNQYSITALTDALGTIVERYAYDAYGGLSVFDGSGTARTSTAEGNRYTYTGREWDEDLDIYHYRARMYDPEAGRFLGRDPTRFGGSKWNLFEFLKSSPLSNTDPSGMFLGWGYGNYCGWSRRGQNGPPIDALDAACQRHDKCQATWWTANPCHVAYCSMQLCLEAHAAERGPCVGNAACQKAAREVQILFCGVVLADPSDNVKNPWDFVGGPKL